MNHRLLVSPCEYKAAKFAVENWHYSRSMPRSKMNTFGVWENGEFVGCIIYSYGANRKIGDPYGLTMFQVVELTRIALKKHLTPVSKIISISLKLLKRFNPGLKLVVSYADIDQDHLGKIYQASNWIYTGIIGNGVRTGFWIKDKKVHNRTVADHGVIQNIENVRKYLDRNATEFFSSGKHKYLYPLDDDIRKKVICLSMPYPKCGDSSMNRIATDQVDDGGVNPTSPHQ